MPATLSPTNLPDEARLAASQLTAIAQRRRLLMPLLLLLAGHQPLAFASGQLLYVGAPLAHLLGWAAVDRWAAFLSAPHAAQQLTQQLAQAQDQPSTFPEAPELLGR